MQEVQMPRLDQTETFIVIQGLQKLIEENNLFRTAIFRANCPGERHIPELIDTYDRRAVYLTSIANKFTEAVNRQAG